MIRIAGAPISWGVCEVPGWGHQLAPERVLAEMRAAGLQATELGPDGFLPGPPAAKAALLRQHGLTAVGGFVPVVLHDPDHDPRDEVDRALDGFVAAGARTLVLAAATGSSGYDARPAVDALGWRTLLANLDALTARAAGRGIIATLHPHVGTVVEGEADVERVLDGCDVPLCLDTGHLLVGGTDPAKLARRAPGRIAHAHLKDVDAGWAERVRRGATPYTTAVARGMYRPLGRGDIDVAAIVAALTAAGYAGWYVLEKDTVLAAEPPPGEGPIADTRASLAYLREVAAWT
jgi:inosose dehydratase